MANEFMPQADVSTDLLQASPPAFLDPHVLIDRSLPRGRSEWFWAIGGTFILLMLIAAWAGSQAVEIQGVMRAIAALVMIGGAIALAAHSWNVGKRRNEESRLVESVEELVQLRRWPEAAMWLQQMLSSPMRTMQGRVQALAYLGTVLSRYHRYADAVTVQEYLLENILLDDAAVHALRCGRAIAMLHEDRLVDADRAINELRRDGAGERSGALALVEIYRDVKTGHPAEAIETFQARLPLMRRQLGHRVADAWALVARAYDMVGQEALAAQAYLNATALMPIAEISARYGEVAALTGRYPAAIAPVE